jgi:hypothetical protein
VELFAVWTKNRKLGVGKWGRSCEHEGAPLQIELIAIDRELERRRDDGVELQW